MELLREFEDDYEFIIEALDELYPKVEACLSQEECRDYLYKTIELNNETNDVAERMQGDIDFCINNIDSPVICEEQKYLYQFHKMTIKEEMSILLQSMESLIQLIIRQGKSFGLQRLEFGNLQDDFDGHQGDED